ncbi:MAG: hypothetical protein M1497_04145 [Nitrospirae bacterium]|nr:hypothetical protein [Nitrospirota bacterium]
MLPGRTGAIFTPTACWRSSSPRQFVVMEELPRMGSGKIDFRNVAAPVIALLHKSR